MADPVVIDLDWLTAHALPSHPADTDKDDRGHVLVVGGSRQVPGGLRLTGEAALRAGAGRVQFAVPHSLAVPLGMAVPEAGVIALAENSEGHIEGDLSPDFLKSLGRCDCIVVGPAMVSADAAGSAVERLFRNVPEGARLVIDAAAIGAAADLPNELERFGARAVLTPNSGEMAGLLGLDAAEVVGAPERAAQMAVERFGASIVLKGARTIIGIPGEELLAYTGASIGLATGGSGDVLAGILGGLMARGVTTRDACAWAVWLHGEAGRRLTEQIGTVGFLARELLDLIPQLMRARL